MIATQGRKPKLGLQSNSSHPQSPGVQLHAILDTKQQEVILVNSWASWRLCSRKIKMLCNAKQIPTLNAVLTLPHQNDRATASLTPVLELKSWDESAMSHLMKQLTWHEMYWWEQGMKHSLHHHQGSGGTYPWPCVLGDSNFRDAWTNWNEPKWACIKRKMCSPKYEDVFQLSSNPKRQEMEKWILTEHTLCT